MGYVVRVSSVYAGMSYAPEFLAKELGLFREEDLEVNITNFGPGPWAARSIAGGEAEIGMGGMWRPLMYRKGIADFRVFAQISARCHASIIGRRREPGFSLSALAGAVVIMPTGAPSQGAFLDGLLRHAGVDTCSVRYVHDFGIDEARALFESGLGDYMLATSPDAEDLAETDAAYIVGPLSELGGAVPWSVYYADVVWLERNQDIAARFARGVERGRNWAREHTGVEAVPIIASYLGNKRDEVLITAYDAVRERGIWTDSVVVPPESQARWQRMLVEASLVETELPYEECYDPRPAALAIEG